MNNDKQLSFGAALVVRPYTTSINVHAGSALMPCPSIPERAQVRLASILHDYAQTSLTVTAIGIKHSLTAATVTHVAKAAGIELRGRGRTNLTKPSARDRNSSEWQPLPRPTTPISIPEIAAHDSLDGPRQSVISFRISIEEARWLDGWRVTQSITDSVSRSQIARSILLDSLTRKSRQPLNEDADARNHQESRKIVISFRVGELHANTLDAWRTQQSEGRNSSRGQLARQILLDVLSTHERGPESTVPTAAPQQNLHLTEKDITGDIEHLIAGLVIPYVDVTNPMLHFDELKAECRAKVARILYDGALSKCATRAKIFAFIKTALKNHIRSLVVKHAFALKRGGTGARRINAKMQNHGVCEAKKTIVLRLDDSEARVQVGEQDVAPLISEFFEEANHRLTPQENAMLRYLLNQSALDDDGWSGSAALPPELAGNGMTQVEFEGLREKVRSVCYAILSR